MSHNGHLDARIPSRPVSRISIIDADGHWLELRAGDARGVPPPSAARPPSRVWPWRASACPTSLKMTVGRAGTRRRSGQEAFWSSPCETVHRDSATALMPRLMYTSGFARHSAFDFAVVYPTAGLGYHRMQDTPHAPGHLRAYNVLRGGPFPRARGPVIQAAIIPMYTPRRRPSRRSSSRPPSSAI